MSLSIENYGIISELGKGVYGKVYRAINKITGETVAIKVIPIKRYNKYVRREVAILKKMTKSMACNNIIKMRSAFADKSNIYIVMDFASGHSLEKKIIPKELWIHYAKKLIEAVKCIHNAGVAHNDIKLDNIVAEPFLQFKLVDFGFACMTNSDGDVSIENQCTFVVGTPAYISPEKLFGGKMTSTIAISSDVWAVGVVLFYLAYGRYPFNYKDVDIMYAHIKIDEPEFPASSPEIYRKIILPLLNKNVEQRMKFWNSLDIDIISI